MLIEGWKPATNTGAPVYYSEGTAVGIRSTAADKGMYLWDFKGVQGGQAVRLRGRVKATLTAGTASIVIVHWGDPLYTFLKAPTVYQTGDTGGAWQTFDVSFTADPAAVLLRFDLRAWQCEGAVLFDQIELVTAGGAEPDKIPPILSAPFALDEDAAQALVAESWRFEIDGEAIPGVFGFTLALDESDPSPKQGYAWANVAISMPFALGLYVKAEDGAEMPEIWADVSFLDHTGKQLAAAHDLIERYKGGHWQGFHAFFAPPENTVEVEIEVYAAGAGQAGLYGAMIWPAKAA